MQLSRQKGLDDSDALHWDSLLGCAGAFFKSAATSCWVVLSMLFPALLPLLRQLRCLFPEPLLVRFGVRTQIQEIAVLLLLISSGTCLFVHRVSTEAWIMADLDAIIRFLISVYLRQEICVFETERRRGDGA